MTNLIDSFGRHIDYLRVSVTDRCNFRCVYCMPEEGAEVSPKEELLSLEELLRVVQAGVALGIDKVRLTGGEPLVRKDLNWLIAQLGKLGLQDLSLTTNGYGLAHQATKLREAGLHRLNISLDTLQPDRFKAIARRGDLDSVLEGIEASLEAGFSPLKINVVSMKGVNDDETADFARWTLDKPIHVRFIELMPIRWNLDELGGFSAPSAHPNLIQLQLKSSSQGMLEDNQMRRMRIDSSDLIRKIEDEVGPLEPASVLTNGPARTYRLKEGRGTVGFISQISNDLCVNCNRLRLTADGFLRPCLMSDGELDVKTALRSGASDAELQQLFRDVVLTKPERHYLLEGQKVTARGMSAIGG